MTTTEITSNAAAYLTGNINEALTLNDYVGEYSADYDMDAANSAYAVEVEQAMQTARPDWTINGESIIGEYPATHLTEDEAEQVRDAIDSIDVDAILAAHTA